MDVIIAIFQKISKEPNFSINYLMLLAVVVMVFALVMSTFFNKVLHVLELREANTTSLEDEAEKRFEKATELSEGYRAKVDIAHREAQKKLQAEKDVVVEKEMKIVKAEEAKLQAELNKVREEALVSINKKKEKILKEADVLASSLVDKIIQ